MFDLVFTQAWLSLLAGGCAAGVSIIWFSSKFEETRALLENKFAELPDEDIEGTLLGNKLTRYLTTICPALLAEALLCPLCFSFHCSWLSLTWLTLWLQPNRLHVWIMFPISVLCAFSLSFFLTKISTTE